jgi:hypothetical protein
VSVRSESESLSLLLLLSTEGSLLLLSVSSVNLQFKSRLTGEQTVVLSVTANSGPILQNQLSPQLSKAQLNSCLCLNTTP